MISICADLLLLYFTVLILVISYTKSVVVRSFSLKYSTILFNIRLDFMSSCSYWRPFLDFGIRSTRLKEAIIWFTSSSSISWYLASFDCWRTRISICSRSSESLSELRWLRVETKSLKRITSTSVRFSSGIGTVYILPLNISLVVYSLDLIVSATLENSS